MLNKKHFSFHNILLVLVVLGLVMFAFYFLFYDNIFCERKIEDINNLLNNANYCEQDSDCIVFSELGCPFGCYNLINKDGDLTQIKQLFDDYNNMDSCSRCAYDCDREPFGDDVLCVNNKCIDKRYD